MNSTACFIWNCIDSTNTEEDICRLLTEEFDIDREYISRHLDFLTVLCREIEIYELGFIPDQSVVDFILANDKR